jgi:hypothetical protein
MRTAIATTWHTDARGFFELPAGTACREVDLERERLPAQERDALRRAVKRGQDSGGNPVPVLLAGQVRVLDCSELDGGTAPQWGPEPAAVSKGGIWPDPDESLPAATGYQDAPRVQRRAAAERARR